MNAAIKATNLNISRGRIKATPVIENLSFTIKPATITGLLGPSGCGKTTLMRAIVGVQRYYNQLTVLGRPAGSRHNLGRIGYVTQQASVYSTLSAQANLNYFAALNPVRKIGQVDALIDVLGLGAVAYRPVSSLSGGQRGRVSLGCALVGAPQLLVLDEPTVGLDPVLREEIWEYLRGLTQKDGVTLLVSSHVMDEALHCDEVLLLRQGRLLAQETPHDMLERAGSSTFEEAFLTLIKQQERH